MESLSQKISSFVEKEFDTSALPAIEEFIRIPNTSKQYDAEWQTNGLLEKAANHLKAWVESQKLENATIEILQQPGLSPFIFIEVKGHETSKENILMYGHFDKQPHMVGWREGLGPTKPVIEGEKLYGRGGADDGYSIFASVLALKACQVNGLPHSRVCIMIEGDEESGSSHLPIYFDLLASRIGKPDLMICLDSGCMNYDQLWLTSTLRGNLKAKLNVKVVEEGVHSGDASGIVPDTFRIIRQLISRFENPETGEIHKDFTVEVPEHRLQEAKEVSSIVGDHLRKSFPWTGNTQPVANEPLDLYLNRTWKPQLTVVGQDGLPPTAIAGNVIRPETTIQISLRLPPTLDAEKAFVRLKEIVEKDPPYNAQVTLSKISAGYGWNAPKFNENLHNSLKEASQMFWKKELMQLGEGGSIPFMNMLAEKFPTTQFCVLGVLGPNSNAHGPNEFLHLGYTKKLISSVAYVLSNCYNKLSQ